MKTAQDPRHQKRIDIIKELFAQSFNKNQPCSKFTQQILLNIDKIDQQITQAAPQWPLNKVAKVDLAILRLAVYELTITKIEPPKVIIDEAIEIAKEYAGDTSSSFINGALGTIVTKLNRQI